MEFETTVKGIGLAPGDLITITYLKEGLERQPFRVVKHRAGAELSNGADHGAVAR